jgi:hypothetical protein
MNIPTRQPPTAQQVVAQQGHTATPRFGEPPPSTAVAAPKPLVPAVADSRTSVQAYLNEIAPASIVGRMVKFNSKGSNYVTSDDGEPIDEGSEYIVLADQTLIGMVKFNGAGEPPDRVMGLLYDGFVMPPRASLGDTNAADWPTGLDGKPNDPWQHQMYLVLQSTDTAELFSFVTSSATGRRAIGNLLHHYDRMQRTNPGELPVIKLKVGGFNHKDERIGWVPTPVFAVVGRAPRDSAAKPDTSSSGDLNDAIPF